MLLKEENKDGRLDADGATWHWAYPVILIRLLDRSWRVTVNLSAIVFIIQMNICGILMNIRILKFAMIIHLPSCRPVNTLNGYNKIQQEAMKDRDIGYISLR